MLNISPNRVHEKINHKLFASFRTLDAAKSGRLMLKLSVIFFVVLLIILFLPWTQNIRSRGNVITLRPEHRPQTIHSVIAGRIEKWFVMEGAFVEKGDTILFISEIKDEYFDPNLLERTREQLSLKELSADSYQAKAAALENQIEALVETSALKIQQAANKLQQAELKVESDSIDYEAAQTNFQIAQEQFNRMEQLHERGLKSLTELEGRKLTLQKRRAEVISAENQLLASKNEVLNARVELISIEAQYRDEIAKAQSERFTALSNMYDTETSLRKLENQYMNYSVRTGYYYITAPQKGYVTKAIRSGLGETIKEGEPIVSIMPADYDLAVQMYVKPLDLPLLEIGQPVRIQFDGWPAIVFSGWPNTSYGTYGGRVFAMDNFISENGMYRILVAQDPNDHPWPDALRVGAGTNNILLLKDVPIWYELWRQINGFPPDFYKTLPSTVVEPGKEK